MNKKKLPTRYNLPTKNGFTVIELLLYVSIAAIILLLTSVFLAGLLQSRVKNQTVAEVEGQGLQVMQIITKTVRNAENITSPTEGASEDALALDVIEIAQDPTIIDLVSGVIRVTEGAESAVALTNSRVVASGLTFQNLSRPDTPGTLRIQFTLSHINPGNSSEYSYEKTFTGSATLRHP